MNVFIAYKWERDSDEATISSDGSLKWFDTKLRASDDEAAAIVCAKQLTVDTGGTLTAVTIGDGDATWALARGASRAVSIGGYFPAKDNAVTASALVSAIRTAGDTDVVVLGDAREFSGVVPAVAAQLGLPLVAGVADFAVDPENQSCVIAHRNTDQAQETLRIHMPVVISVCATSKEKTAPTIRQIMAAKRLPIDKLDAAELGELPESSLQVTGCRLPIRREAQLFEAEGDADKAVNELVATLHARNVL